jgi:predicted PurR-regulated permease PerM
MSQIEQGTHSNPTGGARAPALPPWPWIWKLAALIVTAVFASLLGYNLVKQLQDLLWMLVAALFLSFALEPAAAWLARKGIRRGSATFLLLAGVGALGILLLALMVPVFVDQLQALVAAAPDIVNAVAGWAQDKLGLDLSPDKLEEALRDASQTLATFARNVVGNVLGVGAALVGALFRVLAIALFTYYLVADGPKVRRQICSVLPRRQQQRVLRTWEIAISKTGAYIYSRLILALASGLATFVVLTVLGVEFALPLAAWMGLVSQFIPTIGTYIAMSLPLLVAVVNDPWEALILLVFFVVYQQVENYVLAPRISARTMDLHPAIAFGAAIAGVAIAGLVGAFLALPAAAIVQAVVSAYVSRHEVVETELTRRAEDEPRDERGALMRSILRRFKR